MNTERVNNMKKRRLFISAFLGMLLAFSIFMFAIISFNSNYLNIFKLNWNCSLPKTAVLSEVYDASEGAGFHGDGIRYHIYSYRYAEPILHSFNWQKSDTATVYHENIPQAADEWLDHICVPEEKRPDYNACCYTYLVQSDNSEAIIFWNRYVQKIYIVESFM